MLISIENLTGSNFGDDLRGDNGVNALLGNDGRDTLIDFNFNDTLYGNEKNNKIFGHNGDDALAAGGGISKLYGGSGSDSFALSDGFAFVMDFVDDVDQLDVSNYGFSTLADALMNLDQVGNHACFRVDGDALFVLIVLKNSPLERLCSF